MDNFRPHGNRGGQQRGGFGGRRPSFGGNRDRQMFKAVCSNCGRDCEVPFRPTGEKPVLCSDCFEKAGGGRDNRRDNGRGRPDRGHNDDLKAQLTNIETKLDKILELLSATPATPEVSE